jgi:dynein light intermediate chain 1
VCSTAQLHQQATLHKPNTLKRDRIVVPAGWYSCGEIVVLRDDCDVKTCGEGWEHDLSFEAGAEKQYAAII